MIILELPENLEPFITGALKSERNWLTAGLTSSLRWPSFVIETLYLGHRYWLLPETKLTPPAIATLQENDSCSTEGLRLMRFISALAWGMKSGITTSGVAASGYLRVNGSHISFRQRPVVNFCLPPLPVPQSKMAEIALALIRNARSFNDPSIQFLSYYRVLETAVEPKKRKSWIVRQLHRLPDLSRYLEFNLLTHMAVDAEKISEHIYLSRRHAIAHANADCSIIDPDDPSLHQQIRLELRLMDHLAERAIEEEHGIPSTETLQRVAS